MKHISALLFAAALLFRPSFVFAQFGLHSQFLSQGISAQQYQPALLLFQDGQLVQRLVGVQPKSRLEAELDELLAKKS